MVISSEHSLHPLDASKLVIQLNGKIAGELSSLSDLQFGTVFTPHMLDADWNESTGWSIPVIRPFSNLSLHPASSCLHYGLEAFEGLKAFRLADGTVSLFRPEENIARLHRSCERIGLPTFDEAALLELLKTLVQLESAFIPHTKGFSLYLRPLVISTQPTLGVFPPKQAKLLVMCCPSGPYFQDGQKALRLLADSRYVRAWPGGSGEYKWGGNYGATIMPQAQAIQQGYSQILWLFPDEGGDFYLTECGAMNLFLYWKNEEGEDELTTFPLKSNLILPGVTRDSLLHIAREHLTDIRVTERGVKMKRDVLKALAESRVYEMFACGTACSVASIACIRFQDIDYPVPLGEHGVGQEKGIGPLGELLLNKLWDIQYGSVPKHPWMCPVPTDDERCFSNGV